MIVATPRSGGCYQGVSTKPDKKASVGCRQKVAVATHHLAAELFDLLGEIGIFLTLLKVIAEVLNTGFILLEIDTLFALLSYLGGA